MPTNYDPGVDYSALIAQEAAKGVNANRPLLAAYETARNAKIAGEGLGYAQTHVYTQEAGRPRYYYTATDQSGYIDELYDAARSRSLSALEGAYEAQLAALDGEADALPAAYRAAKNAAAGSSAVERRNIDESFAAAGLNSGAAAQARLSMSTQLLGELSALDAEKAAREADISARRTAALAEYRSAIAAAVAENETARARALYEEAVRVDESYREAEQELALQESYLDMLPEITAAYASAGAPAGGTYSAARVEKGEEERAKGAASASRSAASGGGGKRLIALM